MRISLALLVAVVFFCPIPQDNWAADVEVKFNLLSLPSSRQAEIVLSSPAQIEYQHAPLRACVAQMAERYRFSYWIDRRVDADRLLDLQVRHSNVRECLSRLALVCNAEVGLVENVVTIARADHLAAMQYAAVRLHDQLSRGHLAHGQSSDAQSSAAPRTGRGISHDQAQLKPLSWSQLTTPSELATQLSTTWELPLMATMPHDLMNEGSLQPCTLATQCTLLFGGFDQCAAGRRPTELKIVPLPRAASWQATYSQVDIDQRNVEAIATEYPAAKLNQSGKLWTLRGSTAAHLRLLRRLTPTARQPAQPGGLRNNKKTKSSRDPLGEQKYTISKIEQQPIRSVLTALGTQLGLEIQWDTKLSQTSMLAIVTLEAKDAKLDDILQRLAAQAKITIEREGSTVSVTVLEAGP